MLSLALAYLAGAVTILNPCVLPVLPLVITSALEEGRFAPLALIGGLVASFVVVGTGLATIGFSAGFDPAVVRIVAAAAFMVFGAILLFATLQERFALAASPVSGAANDLIGRIAPAGTGGQFVVGALLGAVWSPCVGPTLGAAIVLAGDAGGLVPAATTMLVFGLGAGSVLAALAYGLREMLRRRDGRLASLARWAKPALGLVLLTLGTLVLTGLDKKLEAALVSAMPDWLLVFTTTL